MARTFRAMKSLLCSAIPLLALASCATSKESAPPAPPPAPTVQSAAEKPFAPPPAPAAPPSGATTASEAAERVHEEWVRSHGSRSGGAGGDVPRTEAEDRPCSSDDQCALTRVPPGGCCDTLCAPRAVTRARADALNADDRACTHGKTCPEVSCHPLGQQGVDAKCEAGRCTARRSPGGGQ
jgi:hypothetical protein